MTERRSQYGSSTQTGFTLGVQIHMSKKLFLAAASVAALTFAGAASAGEISGKIANKPFTKTSSYVIADAVIVDEDDTLTGVLTATNTLTNNIRVALNAQRDHLVTFKVSGATVEDPELTYEVSNGGSVVPTLLSTTNGEIQFLVTVSGTTAEAVVSSLTLTADITQDAAKSIAVESKVVAVIGATNIDVDVAPSVTAVEYKPFFKSLTVDASDLYELVADLPDYATVNGNAGGYLSDSYSAVQTGTFYKDLTGVQATAADFIKKALVTVKGPIINDDVVISLLDGDDDDLGTVKATTEANTAVFELTPAQAAAFVTGDNAIYIQNSGDDAYRLGKYTVTWTPEAFDGYKVPAASSADSGTIKLQGTNYVAPWVSGTGAATSVVRISNSNSVESGAVTVRLLNAVKVVGGVATPYASAEVHEAGTVPAGGDLQITSAQLVETFGAFTRGDFQITINSDSSGFTAKMRNTRDGASFEQSLAD